MSERRAGTSRLRWNRETQAIERASAVSDQRLVQFQCQEEGTLFYYQHTKQGARVVIQMCPVCGSKSIKPTDRTWPAVSES